MELKKKNQKKKIIRVFAEYAFHIWVIIFISNVLILYAFRFFIMASTGTNKTFDTGGPVVTTTISPTEPVELPVEEVSTPIPSESVDPTPTIKPKKPSPTPTPEGPVVSLSFSLPGISTLGGNIKPLRPEREVRILFYNRDSNVADKNVRPLHVIKTKVNLDTDPSSRTYMKFVNPYIDVGKEVIGQSYQIGLKTSQSLIMVLKEPGSKKIGGDLYKMRREGDIIRLPSQEMIIGDIYPVPDSDNVMDINDYNMLRNCFGQLAVTKKCNSGSTADLDDNGVIDGTDYNLMLLSFQILKSKGYTIPSLVNKPKIIINPVVSTPLEKIDKLLKPKPTITIVPTKIISKTKTSSSGGGGGIFVILIIFIIIIAIAAFVVFKFHLLDKFLKKTPKAVQTPQGENPQPPVNPSDSSAINPLPAADTTLSTNKTGSTIVFDAKNPNGTESAEQKTQAPAENPSLTVSKDTKPTEIPFEPAKPIQSVEANPAAATTPAQSIQTSDLIEKSGFLKKVTVDAEKNGTWVTIADDSGITRGFVKGTNVIDGFSKVKGAMKTDPDGKQYLDITELTAEE